MKKQFCSIFILASIWTIARPTVASAAGGSPVANSLDKQANTIVSDTPLITTQPINSTVQPTANPAITQPSANPTNPTTQPKVTVNDIKKVIAEQTGIQQPAAVDPNKAGGGVIDSGAKTAQDIADKQTAGIMSALDKLPGGSIATSFLKSKIAAGIGDLTKQAQAGFDEWMSDPDNPVGGYADMFNGAIAGLFGGGGGDPDSTSKQAEASQKAIDTSMTSFGDGATSAAKDIAQFTDPNVNSITVGISNIEPNGDLDKTVANVRGRLAVAEAFQNTNPATGQRDDLSLAQAAASRVVATSVVGIAGIATTQSDMAQVGLANASANYYGSASRDNSLDKLTDIGKGISASTKVAAQNAKYVSKSVTLTGELLKQTATESERLIRRAQDEDYATDYKIKAHQGGWAFLAGVSGALVP
jgi:hypothetical protein